MDDFFKVNVCVGWGLSLMDRQFDPLLSLKIGVGRPLRMDQNEKVQFCPTTPDLKTRQYAVCKGVVELDIL